MISLTTKLQYEHYEKGEFSGIKLRNAEEVIQLITDYPWEEQRHLASVELTCPSVTIEDPLGRYLKIGPYFNGKFCLYLNDGRRLAQKILPHLEDSFEIINNFYQAKVIWQEFESYTWVFQPKKYFDTNTFEYIVNSQFIFRKMKIPIAALALLGIFFFYLIFSKEKGMPIVMTGAILIFFIFKTIASLSHYTEITDFYLKLSSGQNNFYFGTIDNFKKYLKSDITQIKQYCSGNRKRRGYIVFEIDFINGERIRFTNYLLSEGLIEEKFYAHTIVQVDDDFPKL